MRFDLPGGFSHSGAVICPDSDIICTVFALTRTRVGQHSQVKCHWPKLFSQTGRNIQRTGWFVHLGRGGTDPLPEAGPENLTVNEGLNPIDLIFYASPAVQLVFLILLTLSIVSWVIIVQRWLVLAAAQKGVLSFEQRFWSGMDLSQLYKEGTQMQKEDLQIVGMENIFRAGFKEFMRLRAQSSVEGEAIMEGAQRAMRVAYSREEEKLERHLSFLATVGSVSPYIGLFGTVIGIMNSFLGLATQAQATLQVVAPGIAEALFATAIGLFAAIPAVVAYNRYSSTLDFVTSSYITFTDEFSSILHRQIHSN